MRKLLPVLLATSGDALRQPKLLAVAGDVPKRGADNKLVCFVHPKGVNGVLVELCQSV